IKADFSRPSLKSPSQATLQAQITHAPVFLCVTCAHDERVGSSIAASSTQPLTTFDQTFTFQLPNSQLSYTNLQIDIRIDRIHSKQQPSAQSGVSGAIVFIPVHTLVACL